MHFCFRCVILILLLWLTVTVFEIWGDFLKPLTDKQRAVYECIVKCIEENGFPPTVREICSQLGLNSPSTAQLHLNTLEKHGLITREGSKNRAIRLVDKPRKGIPIVGTVTAGMPILAVEQLEGYLPYETPDDGEYFALRVRGDSMIDAGILDGDKVVVRQQSFADNGTIVVALIGEEATVKRFKTIDGQPWLLPENEAYEPIDAREAVILGKVKMVLREF